MTDIFTLIRAATVGIPKSCFDVLFPVYSSVVGHNIALIGQQRNLKILFIHAYTEERKKLCIIYDSPVNRRHHYYPTQSLNAAECAEFFSQPLFCVSL